MDVLHTLDEDKHAVANNVKNCVIMYLICIYGVIVSVYSKVCVIVTFYSIPLISFIPLYNNKS